MVLRTLADMLYWKCWHLKVWFFTVAKSINCFILFYFSLLYSTKFNGTAFLEKVILPVQTTEAFVSRLSIWYKVRL